MDIETVQSCTLDTMCVRKDDGGGWGWQRGEMGLVAGGHYPYIKEQKNTFKLGTHVSRYLL